MKHMLIFALSPIAFSSLLPLHGMDKRVNQPASYRDAATGWGKTNRHQGGNDQKYRLSRTVATTTRSMQTTAHDGQVYRPAGKPQGQKPNESPITILKKTSQEESEELYIPTQPDYSSEEEATPQQSRPTHVSVEIKTIERLALMTEMLPKVLAQSAQDKITIRTLEEKLLSLAQSNANTLHTMQLHHTQETLAQNERHLATLKALHKEFDAQMLAKQEAFNKLVETQRASYNNIMQTMMYQHQLLYALCVQCGIIRTLPPEQVQENTATDDATGNDQDIEK